MEKTKIKRIAVLTSGGDSPGMNAAIRAVVRTAIFNDIHIYGVKGGYQGLINGEFSMMSKADVGNILQRGGTILKTARSMEFMTEDGRKNAYENLVAHDIDACVMIGGNGTYTGALKLHEEFNFPVIGIPGTIDNDINGTDFTIGFDTAINTAIEAVDKIRDTADSHDRLFFIEVMGRHAGYIALHTGIGSGAGTIFLPEVGNSIETFVQKLRRSARRKKLFNLVIVAEGNKNGNAFEIAQEVQALCPEYETKVMVIGHLQRGGSPSCFDRILASKLGHGAVSSLLNQEFGQAIGVINNKINLTPLSKAIEKKNDLDVDLLNVAEILAL